MMITTIDMGQTMTIAGFVGAACAASPMLKAPRALPWAPLLEGRPMIIPFNFIVHALLRLSAFLHWTRTGEPRRRSDR
ncbi:hypothetical protein [Bosea sp. ASV33]|uniref:hypothetical protein n=1 Tax=Bosea sp. ASV33 TaxID=2795106 RepID=UPI0018ED877B|nr:hypothetical protein [Bosea sp. ASV33]